MNTILTSIHKTRLHILRIFALLLVLMVGGTANEAWAKKITYHILTLPFDVKNADGTAKWTNIRVEALQCTSEEATVGLPAQFKSPLATGFRYWATATRTFEKLYDSQNNNKIINTKYYIYNCSGGDYACLSNEIENPAETSSDADGIPNDIYVTYEYNSSNGILNLKGEKSYNLAFTNGGVEKYICFNRSRNNRIASALGSGLTGEQLASDDFVVPVNDKKQLGWNWSKWGPQGLLLRFKFIGEDPYNITIMTSYDGPELHITDAITNVDGTGTIKPYAGSVLMSKVNATSMWFDVSNNRHYKISSGITDYAKWTAAKYQECWNAYYDPNISDADRYDSWDGFYRSESPTLNAFAFLNHPTSGYMFVGSKMNQGTGNSPTIYQPNSSGQYYTYYDNYDNDGGGRSQPYFKAQSLSDALSFKFDVVRTYTFYVKTHGSETTISATKEWSDADLNEKITDHLPEAIKRKYVSFTAYSDPALTQPVSTYQDIKDANNDYKVYLKYTVSENMPFDALPLNGSYQNARWYTMRLNADVNEYKYIAYDNGTSSLITTDGSGEAKGDNSKMHTGENSAEVQVAFMGDPFELKILSRKASETATPSAANRYIGCATDAADNTTLSTNKTGSSDISTWEIAPDNVTGSIVLRKFESYDNPMYIGLGSSANKPVTYSSTASRIKVVELEKKKYMYHIVRSDGSVAVMASTMQDVGQPLNNYTHIPEDICTPFLNPTLGYSPSLSFYYTKENATASSSPQINAPYVGDGVTEGIYAHIYVRYSFGSALPSNTYNVRLNGQYIYYNSSSSDESKIDYASAPGGGDEYKWALAFSDPYSMTINNVAAGKFVTVDSWTNNAVLGWGGTGSKFIIKSSYTLGVYEVMAATGEDVDASETYYNIGRNGSQVRIYDNNTYEHTYAQLRFLLTSVGSSAVDYHLYDKSGSELLVVRSHSDQLTFPSDYYSPLVDTYRFWTTSARNVAVSDLNNVTPVEGVKHVYVDYTTNNLVDLKKGALYLLKFNTGDDFRQEDGHDDLTKTPVRAIYPYCNGDCNFFIYGQDEYELQQQGAASTRTRWVWYLESANNDPYHVKISSRQQETYPAGSGNDYNAYFRTYAVKYQQDAESAAPHIVTTLAWPGITGEQGTEYMVLGSAGRYQLLTTETIPIDLNGDSDYDDTNESNQRHVVKSFEQYWKTYDTVKNKLLKDILEDKDKGASPTGSTLVPEDPSSYRTLLTGTGSGQYGFHSYPHWAYAKRFNGYNAEGESKKGWEEIEHWYQTVNMGEGYFNFVKTNIDPALILLDQHGWEIMRKALPSGPDEDPETKAAKYAAIRPYDSPMVKEYYFWTSSKKMTGYHQYYNLGGQITVNGEPYTSTSLTDLPPYATAKNVKDTKGNLNDQYVTYVVKDEYAHSYNPLTKEGAKFLIQQGNNYVSTANGSTLTTNPATGGMAAVIVAADGSFSNNDLWYVKPNPNIDNEMGYGVSGNASSTHSGWNVDYTDDTKLTGYPSNGFDPYNIQISSAAYPTKFFVTDATSALLDEGIVSGNGTAISLGTGADPYSADNYYDNSKLAITNKTFMAVADAEGSIQLMPRFDQNKRIRNFSTLESPIGEVDKMNQMKTSLYLPTVYEYHIIDNSGNESLRYKSGGDLAPQTPEHFKSPLAKDFKYYTTLTAGVASDEITASFASATLTNGNVYVRYQFNRDDDALRIFEGKWLTMQLNTKDAIYDSGIKQGTSKPATINATTKTWQWKFLKTPQTDPDPYNVQLFNRNNKGNELPADTHYALLSHTSGGYALAKAGRNDYTYQFLNGREMDDSHNAAIEEDRDYSDPESQSGFTSTSGVFHGKDSQVWLSDEVEHTFTYNIYTNDGVFAISEEQDNSTIKENDYVPVLPENIKSPLLKKDYFRYYNKDDVTFGTGSTVPITDIADTDTIGKALNNLYGLYDDIVCVHYLPYNPDDSEYKVPNAKAVIDGHVAKDEAHSNDASLDLHEDLLYNVIWYNDNMMTTSNDVDVVGHANQGIQTDSKHEWKIGGDDPYALKFYNKDATKYIEAASADNNAACTLSATATTFMLLPTENWEYGELAMTGHEGSKLTITDDDDAGTTDAATITTGTPAKFIIFSLATHKVIYHLIIANIGGSVGIPYAEIENEVRVEKPNKTIKGSTKRDLTSGSPAGATYQLGETLPLFSSESPVQVTYCVDAGQVSLGDVLKVPTALERPNCKYFYYVHGIYDDAICTTPNDALNNKYKGLQVDHIGTDEELLGKTILINVEYQFDDGLPTNTGSSFVLSPGDKKWYTFETSDNTPWLAQYTKAWGLELKEGRESHYTNDFLWAPVGDPYGFVMYDRYMYKSSNQPTVVMTTTSAPTSGATFTMAEPNGYEVYELLKGTSSGFFNVHCLYNNSDLYLTTTTNAEHTYLCLGSESNATELCFGLSEELVKPYYDRAGYVGGLTTTPTTGGKALYEAVDANAELSDGEKLMAKQTIVYNDDNIVTYTPGYYRLHSQPDIKDVTKRYASGYTHDIEKTALDAASNAGLPMHFYEVNGSGTTFALLRSGNDELNKGYTSSDATRGDIPIPAVEYDPASIFYFSGPAASLPTSKLQTQGLWVKGANVSNTSGYAKMTATSEDATTFTLLDIGGAVLLIHDGTDAGVRKYLNFDQTDPDHIYDLGFYHEVPTDYAKWCMEPANKLGLKVATHNGGDAETYGGTSYNYTTLYVPFDVMLPDTAYSDKEKTKISKIYHAVVLESACSPWNPSSTKFDLHPKSIGRYNIEANGCPTKTLEDERELFRTNNRFVPAGTPVLIAMLDNSGYVQLSLPNSSPNPMSSSFISSMDERDPSGNTIPKSTPRTNILSGQYLEQKLALGSTDRIYVFGLPYSGTMTLDPSNGDITATLPLQDNAGMGFYLNANPNKEAGLTKSSWTRNNWYVYSNKVYYRAAGAGAPAMSPEFVPVIFDDGEQPEDEELQPDGSWMSEGDGCIYDLQGRKVATKEQVMDGKWRERLSPGIYILNGRKFKM